LVLGSAPHKKIADIVAEHIWLRNYSTSGAYSEKEVVYYADKRVLHSSVVSLEERMQYIIGTYGREDPGLRKLIRKNFSICNAVEKKLFRELAFEPQDLAEMMID